MSRESSARYYKKKYKEKIEKKLCKIYQFLSDEEKKAIILPRMVLKSLRR